MFRLLNIYIGCIILLSASLASAYNTLILIEFENTSHNLPFDYLRHKLPDIIRDYSEKHVNVEYAGKIEPYLGLNNEKYKDALILLGKFDIDKSIVDFSFSLYDIMSWNKLTEGEYQCKTSDSSCIEDNLINLADNLLYPLFLSKESGIEFISSSNDINKENSIIDNFSDLINNFAIEVDLIHSWEKLYKEGNQFGDRYYKDLDSRATEDLFNNSKERNTERLVKYIDNILHNPYDVSINDVTLNYNEFDNEYIDLSIPVYYNIKKSLIEDMLTTLPNSSTSDSNGSLIIKFSKSDFIFSKSMIDQFAFMKNQVIPVLFLSNNIGKPNYIYIHSNKNNYNLKHHNNLITLNPNKDFYPLYAITPGENNIQINLDLTTLNVIYEFKIHVEEIENFSKIAIKFFYEKEIETILDKFYTLSSQ